NSSDPGIRRTRQPQAAGVESRERLLWYGPCLGGGSPMSDEPPTRVAGGAGIIGARPRLGPDARPTRGPPARGLPRRSAMFRRIGITSWYCIALLLLLAAAPRPSNADPDCDQSLRVSAGQSFTLCAPQP